MKIAIFEDDQNISTIMRVILENNSHEIAVFNECLDLTKKIKKTRPDLVLLDIWISGKYCCKSVKKIKNDDELKDIPIIIVSASEDISETARKFGADGYLSKPFDISELLDIIKKHQK